MTALKCLRKRVILVRTTTESRSEEHTSELQSQSNLVCRLLLEKKKNHIQNRTAEQSTKVRSQSNLLCRLFRDTGIRRSGVASVQYHSQSDENVTSQQTPCVHK